MCPGPGSALAAPRVHVFLFYFIYGIALHVVSCTVCVLTVNSK
jgi:hypothetical protein